MIDKKIVEYFRDMDKFQEFTEIDLELLDYVFATPQQIYGISIFENKNEVEKEWMNVSQEFAVRVQSQLNEELYNLKWDMYLILIIKDKVNDTELRKKIENDRMFFKKFVFSEDVADYEFQLPIRLSIQNSDELRTFSDYEFLNELNKIIPTEIKQRIDLDKFKNQSIDSVNREIFLRPYMRENKL